MTPPTVKCHGCAKQGASDTMGSFILYGVTQWAKMPLFSPRLCQECYDRIKAAVDAEFPPKPKIEVVS